MPFIDLDIGCEITPLSSRAGEDVAEFKVLWIQKRRVIKCARWHGANARNGLQHKPEIRAAARAEIAV